MAGGQLSPRQKMINMMYLVLLALLALNVSREILDSFEIIRQKLANSAVAISTANDETVQGMISTIEEEIENENKLVNKGLMTDTLPLIQRRTNEMIALLNRYNDTMRVIAGVNPETGELEALDQTEDNHRFWMGTDDLANSEEGVTRGNGEAYELREKLEEYYDFVITMYNDAYQPLEASERISEEEVQGFPQNRTSGAGTEDETKKSWERATFDGPVVANMAQLEAMKLDVLAAEKMLLDRLSTRLGVAKFKIDKLDLAIAKESEIVTAGLPFRAQLYITMTSAQITPSFSGPGVKNTGEGTGELEITTSAEGMGDRNEIERTITVSAAVPTTFGGDETYSQQVTYKVRKPEVVITSASVQNLYRSCGNKVNIDVPALGDFYNPSVQLIGGGSATQSQESKKVFLLVPTGQKAIVRVSTNTNGRTYQVGDVAYNVIEPPKPSLQMLVNGRVYDGGTPVPKTSRVQVQVIPDPEFKAALPQDARYGVNNVEVLAQLSLGPPREVNQVGGGMGGATVSLGSQVRQAPPGTKVYIRINEVFRLNFRNQRIVDNRFTVVERTLSLVTR